MPQNTNQRNGSYRSQSSLASDGKDTPKLSWFVQALVVYGACTGIVTEDQITDMVRSCRFGKDTKVNIISP